MAVVCGSFVIGLRTGIIKTIVHMASFRNYAYIKQLLVMPSFVGQYLIFD